MGFDSILIEDILPGVTRHLKVLLKCKKKMLHVSDEQIMDLKLQFKESFFKFHFVI